jgi:LmbE family N-acetylglucosaminyl deacetylase
VAFVRHAPEGTAVVLSPHLDDAVASAWHVLRASRVVTVLNVCTGLPQPGFLGDWDRVTGGHEVAQDSAAFMRLRLAEDEAALALAGRESVGLGFLDLQYRQGAADPLDPAAVAEAIAHAVPLVSELHAPAGLGLHPDHLAVRAAALALAAAHAVPLHLYAEQPYAVRFGWPHWVTGQPPRRGLRPAARWEAHLPDVALAPAHVAVLGGDEAAAKRRALEAYVTQIEALDAGPLRRLEHPEISGYEVRWEVIAAARRRA